MIRLLQDNIQSTMRMKQYTQTQDEKQKDLLTESSTKQALKELYYDKPEFEPIRKYFDDPNIPSSVVGGLINQVQEIQKNSLIEEKGKQLLDKQTQSYDYLLKNYAKDKEASALIQDNMNIGNPPEKALADIQGLENRRVAKASGGGSGSKEDLLSQAKGKNIKSQLRNEGMIVGGNRVYIRGDDTSPYAHSGYYRLKDGVYSKKVGSQWLEVGAEIKTDKKTFDIVEIPESVKTSLNEAIEKFQTANIDAKGKTTTSSTTTTPVKRVKFIP